MRSIRIIGLGNSWRGDDAAGLHVARRVKALLGPHSRVVEAEMIGVELLELMQGAETVILIDGAWSGRPTGTVQRWDVSTSSPPGQPVRHSTHALNAMETVELGRALGVLPSRVLLYAVEVGRVDPGAELSPDVARAVEDAARRIVQEVGNETHA